MRHIVILQRNLFILFLFYATIGRIISLSLARQKVNMTYTITHLAINADNVSNIAKIATYGLFKSEFKINPIVSDPASAVLIFL